MADPRRTLTRRAVLSYDQLKKLTRDTGFQWPDLLIKDYQGIIQDFSFLADEEDALDIRITINEGDIKELEDSHYPNMSSQFQWLQKQIDGLPEFTIDTSGFTTDTSLITTDKVIA